MLTINFTPQRNDNGQQVISWADPVLTIDGVDYDLSIIPDGATVTGEPPILKADRVDNNYELLILLNHGKDAPYNTRFPEPIVNVPNGSIVVPPYNVEVINNELA